MLLHTLNPTDFLNVHVLLLQNFNILSSLEVYQSQFEEAKCY